jgi:hypothetical protein
MDVWSYPVSVDGVGLAVTRLALSVGLALWQRRPTAVMLLSALSASTPVVLPEADPATADPHAAPSLSPDPGSRIIELARAR